MKINLWDPNSSLNEVPADIWLSVPLHWTPDWHPWSVTYKDVVYVWIELIDNDEAVGEPYHVYRKATDGLSYGLDDEVGVEEVTV